MVLIASYTRSRSADCALQADVEKILCLYGKFHRQFAEHLFAEAVDDQVYGVFLRQAALPAIEELVIADLRGGGLVFDDRRRGGVFPCTG